MKERNLAIVRRMTRKNITGSGTIKLTLDGLDRIMEETRAEAVRSYKDANKRSEGDVWAGFAAEAAKSQRMADDFKRKSPLSYFRFW